MSVVKLIAQKQKAMKRIKWMITSRSSPKNPKLDGYLIQFLHIYTSIHISSHLGSLPNFEVFMKC